jgi:hypothetical protein
MASPLEATLLLCDHAVAEPSGKVHMLGAGWSMTTTPTAPQAVVVMLKVPWDRANQKIRVHLGLLDSDGKPVSLEDQQGQQLTIASDQELEVGRPPGLPPGSALDAAFALNVPSLPLAPGRYEWRLDFDSDSRTAAFTVRG